MPPTTPPSPRFVAATKAEIKRLETMRVRALARYESAQAKATELRNEADEIEGQIEFLQVLIGEEAGSGVLAVVPARRVEGFGGRALRIEMMRVVKAGERLHYTSWSERMKRAGIPVSGEDPEATLLTALGRGAIVRAVGLRSGDYIAEPKLADDLLAKIERLEAHVRDHGVKRGDAKVRDLLIARERLVEAEQAIAVLGSKVPT